jgi:uncharacterized membrane protein
MDEFLFFIFMIGGIFALLFAMPIMSLIWIRQVSRGIDNLSARLSWLEKALSSGKARVEKSGAPAAPAATAIPAEAPKTPAATVPTLPPAAPPPESPAAPPPLPPATASAPQPTIPPPPPKTDVPPTAFERAVAKAWNWLVIGEEFRKPGQSWEYALATNWLLRIGIVVVLAGIAFFLKYSIEKGLLAPSGRVALSLLTGLALIIGGVRLLFKKYHLIGQGLAGAGFATLYFAFFAASGIYHLMPDSAGFLMMGCVTVAAGALAVRYQSLLIAVFGVLGGYATPIMLGDAGGSDLFFFGYVLLLGCGVLGIAIVKRWPILSILGMLASYVLAFLYCHAHDAHAQLLRDMVFLSAVHLLYLLSVSAIHIRRRLKTGAGEWVAILLNAAIYWVWVFGLFKPIFGREETGLVSLGVAAIYVALIYLCLRIKLQDRILVDLFIGLAAVMLAMSPALMLPGEWLTLAWCLQALVMLWLREKTGQTFLGKAAMGLLGLACIRGMFWDLGTLYGQMRPMQLTGAAFWKASALRTAAFGALPTTLAAIWRLKWTKSLSPYILGLALVQCLIYLTLESYVITAVYLHPFRRGVVTLVWTIFALALLVAGIRSGSRKMRWCGLLLFAFAVFKLLVFDLVDLDTLYRIVAFISVGVLLVLGSFVYLKYRSHFETSPKPETEKEALP